MRKNRKVKQPGKLCWAAKRSCGPKEYVNRLMPVVAPDYKEDYSKIWLDILEEEAVSSVIYNRGKQQGTLFNRNLVAQISRMMALDGIIVKEGILSEGKEIE